MWDNEAAARAQVEKFGAIWAKEGQLVLGIAKIQVTAEMSVKKTFVAGHYSVTATPSALMANWQCCSASRTSAMLDELNFVNETMTYVDGPMEGFATGPAGECFAFRRYPVVADVLFHWVLIPVESMAVDIATVFVSTRTKPPQLWISIVEDMRTDRRGVYEATLGATHLVPLDWD